MADLSLRPRICPLIPGAPVPQSNGSILLNENQAGGVGSGRSILFTCLQDNCRFWRDETGCALVSSGILVSDAVTNAVDYLKQDLCKTLAENASGLSIDLNRLTTELMDQTAAIRTETAILSGIFSDIRAILSPPLDGPGPLMRIANAVEETLDLRKRELDKKGDSPRGAK